MYKYATLFFTVINQFQRLPITEDCHKADAKIGDFREMSILGDPGADSGGKGKSENVTKKVSFQVRIFPSPVQTFRRPHYLPLGLRSVRSLP